VKTRRLLIPLLLIAAVILPAAAQPFSQSLFDEMRWRLIGPFRAGRTVAIAGVPEQPNVFYMSVNNGGVWKTTDSGNTWLPIFDSQHSGSIGALAVAPSDPNIIYVGSGEGLRRPDLAVGDGIYKSTDAGKTWQHLGLQDGQQIASIIVDPKNPDRLFVAVLGHPYGPNEERGIFRSTDGGRSFQKVLYRDANTGGIDLAFDPTNSNTIFAVLWASRRAPWTHSDPYEAEGSGLYRSTDGGNTWHPLTKGLPTWEQRLGRIGIAIAPSDPKRMYATVEAPKLGGIYRSEDGGESWTRTNNDIRLYGRGSDFAWLRVDPRDKDNLLVANVSLYRSTDGGHTYTAIKGGPGGDDYHSIWINPKNPDIILCGVDQGATISVNGGASWSTWYNQPTAQFYHVVTDNQFPYWVYGAQQESGSVGTPSRSDYGGITLRDWFPVGVEEWGYVAPDPLDPNIIYGSKGSRFDKRTRQVQDVTPFVIRSDKYRFNRSAPMIFSPVDPHALYLGSNVLFKTTTGGASWEVISPDLTRTDPGTPASLGPFADSDSSKGKHRGVIYSIAPSFRDANTLWVGTDDGLVHVTRDGGKTWNNISPAELAPWSKLAQMEASHFDDDTVYLAVNRFRLDDLRPYVYRTHDSGKSWKLITEGLPNEPVNTVREDPVRKGLLFAGTERTVYVSFDDGDHWQPLQLNLPPTSIRDLVVHQDDIVIGTHGRSFWILDNITPLRQLTPDAASKVTLFTPQVTYRLRRSLYPDTPPPRDTPMGQNPPDGAMIDYFLPSKPAGPVVLEIYTADGKLVRRFTSADKPDVIDPDSINQPYYWVRPARVLSADPGMHRWVWDLHYPTPAFSNRELPISAVPGDTPLEPQGPRPVPGQYTVKLTVDGKSYSQPLTLKMDPRVNASPVDLQHQAELELALAGAIDRVATALSQVQKLHKQLPALLGKGGKSLDRSIAALDSKLTELESDSDGAQDDLDLPTLNEHLTSLFGTIDSADAKPTAQAVAMYQEKMAAVEATLKRVQEINAKDVPTLNKELKRHKIPELSVAPNADEAVARIVLEEDEELRGKGSHP
jgi:photosystem II stability/assembly factor-like uncharacterized protein